MDQSMEEGFRAAATVIDRTRRPSKAPPLGTSDSAGGAQAGDGAAGDGTAGADGPATEAKRKGAGPGTEQGGV
jgi:hypothetical protein